MADTDEQNSLQDALAELLNTPAMGSDRFAPLEGDFALYGAGGLGKLGCQLLERIGLKPACILDMNRGISKLYNISVVHPEDLSAKNKEEMTVLISVVNNPMTPIVEYLKSLGFKKIRHFYDATEAYKKSNLISNGWVYQHPTPEDKSKISYIFDHLADDKSRCAYLQMLYWRLKREERVFAAYRPDPETKWYPPDVIPPDFTPGVMLDGGTHDGSILHKHIEKVGSQLDKIFAFEPDSDNFKALDESIGDLPAVWKDKITLHCCALGKDHTTVRFAPHRDLASHVNHNGETKVEQTTIDSLNLQTLDLVKLHIEGSEYPAIYGGLETFIRCRPLIAMTIYHNPDGLWKIQECLMQHLQNYQFYIRLHAYCGIGCILYAVPDELRAS